MLVLSDYEGWSGFAGGSTTYGKGGGVDWIFFKSKNRSFHGMIIGGNIGASLEIHAGFTYSIKIY